MPGYHAEAGGAAVHGVYLGVVGERLNHKNYFFNVPI
jgi:hypothetical protein